MATILAGCVFILMPRPSNRARALSAQAYTVGHHIVFGAGHYAPGTSKGRKLLAHELSHVIQQGAAPPGQEPPPHSFTNEAAGRRGSTEESAVQNKRLSPTGPDYLQRNPEVGFVVHKLERKKGGKIADPDQISIPEAVSWPLSFAVTSPLDAEAEVEVTGAQGDDCTAYELGFLQTVHSQNLEFDYLGQRPQDGSAKKKMTVTLPIRDGEAGSMWYESSSNATASACGSRVSPKIGDYPTILSVDKLYVNTKTNEYNYLSSVRRTIGFATTLVASGGGSVQPLRFFLWSYQMSGTFKPDYTSATNHWPFKWIENSTILRPVFHGKDRTVPLFTSATDTYNGSLKESVTEKS